MPDAYPYNKQFRTKIISLCLQPGWFSRYGVSLVKPEYFELQEEKDVVGAILDFHERFQHVPHDKSDVLVLCDEGSADLIDDIFQTYDYSLVKEEVIRWAKQQAAKIAILDSVDDVREGSLDTVAARIRDASMVGEDLSIPGLDVVEDIDVWLSERLWTDKVATGWLHVDRHLDGGVGPGEMLIMLGPSNRGKTMSLVNIGYGAAGMGSARNVVIFTHEISTEIYAKRFGARMLHRFPNKKEGLGDYRDEFLERSRILLPGRVRIIGGAQKMTTVQIEAHLRRLVDEGFIPDMVIDDYPDLIAPIRNRKDRRFELSEIYGWFRQLGAPGYITDHGFPTIGASQSTRSSFDKEIITERDVAEDINKVAISDIVVALCQTREEAEAERCRLYGAKVRDGERGFMFDAKFYATSQAIITTGISKRREREKDV